MRESKRRRFARYLVAVVVLAVHFALIAALLTAPGNGGTEGSTANSIQLLYLVPVRPPKVHTLMANLSRRGSNLAITVEPPVLESQSFPISRAQGSTENGEGSGVDWAAEARRAL